jgi:hypothetical protein
MPEPDLSRARCFRRCREIIRSPPAAWLAQSSNVEYDGELFARNVHKDISERNSERRRAGDQGALIGFFYYRDKASADHVHMDLLDQRPWGLDLIGRMEDGWYTRTTERFEMPNIPLEEWRREQY